MSLSRRGFVTGLVSAVPLAAEARVDRAIRPKARPRDFGRPPSVSRVLGDFGLSDITGFTLRDLSSGRVLEEHRAKAALPPASVTKAVTALYGLHAMGSGHRYATRVYATGPVQNGRVRGDLYLVGGGDPHLDTDGLADLAKQVTAAGIFGVDGRAYVVGSALPYQREIDPGQPSFVGYNPSISGLNLNFNRVHFDWKPAGGGRWSMKMTARTKRYDPPVSVAEMMVGEGGPTFSYRQAEGRDLWTVNRKALGNGGARWLPVRAPAAYAAEVFRAVAAGQNLRLPYIEAARGVPKGARLVAGVQSAALERIVAAMLKYSTNLTAEVIGLSAHQALGGRPQGIGDSAAAMTAWIRGRFGLGGARFVNHSGLSDVTRVSADEMTQVFDIAASGPLPGLLKDIPLKDANGNQVNIGGCRVAAKTGTLNFTRGLGGYLIGGNGRRMAFTILCADLAARAATAQGVERPRGARRWINTARRQEMALLRRWASLYGK